MAPKPLSRPKTTKKVAVKGKSSKAPGKSHVNMLVLAKLRGFCEEVVRTIDDIERGLVRDHGRLRRGRA